MQEKENKKMKYTNSGGGGRRGGRGVLKERLWYKIES